MSWLTKENARRMFTIGMFAIGLWWLFSPDGYSKAVAEDPNAAQKTQCNGVWMVIVGGDVVCDGEYGVFTFTESDTFYCEPVGDKLDCITQSGAEFIVSGSAPPPPTPFPTYTSKEMATLEEEFDEENVTHSLTGFYDCGIYSVGVSTLEQFGGGYATCGDDNSTFTIDLPVVVNQLWCARDTYGWSCGSEGQSFWFYLLP